VELADESDADELRSRSTEQDRRAEFPPQHLHLLLSHGFGVVVNEVRDLVTGFSLLKESVWGTRYPAQRHCAGR